MELVEVGLPAVGLLRQGLTDPDVEVARRCERCLKRIEHDVPISEVSAAVARLVDSAVAGDVAQWESTAFASRGSGVRIPSSPPIPSGPSRSTS